MHTHRRGSGPQQKQVMHRQCKKEKHFDNNKMLLLEKSTVHEACKWWGNFALLLCLLQRELPGMWDIESVYTDNFELLQTKLWFHSQMEISVYAARIRNG